MTGQSGRCAREKRKEKDAVPQNVRRCEGFPRGSKKLEVGRTGLPGRVKKLNSII